VYLIYVCDFPSLPTPPRSFLRDKRIAEQLEQTDALLNKYVNILSKTDQVARLIFDERWMGAEAVRLYLLVFN